MRLVWRIGRTVCFWLRWPALVGAVWLVWWLIPQRPIRTVHLPPMDPFHSFKLTPAGLAVYHDTSRQYLIINDIPNGTEQYIPVSDTIEFGLADTPGSWLKVLSQQGLHLYSLSDAKKLLTIPIRGTVDSVRRSVSDHRLESHFAGRIAVTFNDNLTGETIEIWDVNQQKRLCRVHDLRQPAFLDPKGGWFVSCKNGCSDFAAFDAETGQEIAVLKAPPESERQVAQLLDDGRIAIGWSYLDRGLGCALAVWDPANSKSTLRWVDRKLYDIEILPETYVGRKLFIQSSEGADVWNLNSNPPTLAFWRCSTVKPARPGFVFVYQSRVIPTFSNPRNPFELINAATDRVEHAEIPAIRPLEIVDDWFIDFVESEPFGLIDYLPTWLGRWGHVFDSPAKWVIHELRTGRPVQWIPIDLNAPGAVGRGLVAEPWYWEIREGTNETLIRQWPLIAPGRPWWLGLVVVIGAIMFVRDCRRKWCHRTKKAKPDGPVVSPHAAFIN